MHQATIISLLLFIAIVCGDYFSDQIATVCKPYNTGGPRIRRSYFDLSTTQRKNLAMCFLKMKEHNEVWVTNPTSRDLPSSLYDLFIKTHENYDNAQCWHGTTAFVLVHKYFIWCFESALRYIGTIYYSSLGMTLQDACTMTLPYYPSELDAIAPAGGGVPNSKLWDKDIWGSYKPDSEVTDGVFSSPSWVCTSNASLPSKPSTNRLLRKLVISTFTTGAASLANYIIDNPKAWNFSERLENHHGSVHNLFAYLMITMSSPNEPTFFLHHCNIDRLYHLWADCHGYDSVNSGQLTFKQYEPANPELIDENSRSPPPPPKQTQNKVICSVTLQDKVTYYWKNSGDSKVFPSTKWPTIRSLWSMGKTDDPGYDGMNYRYGPDALVALDALKNNCPDKSWTYCNVPVSQKRSEDDEIKEQEIHPVVQRLNEKYHSKLLSGRTSMESLRELAMEECESVPKPEMTDDLRAWSEMSGEFLQARICDKPDSEKNGTSTRSTLCHYHCGCCRHHHCKEKKQHTSSSKKRSLC